MKHPSLWTFALAAACLIPQGCKHAPNTVQAATAPAATAPSIQVPSAVVRDNERQAAAADTPPAPEPTKQEEPPQPHRSPRRSRPAQSSQGTAATTPPPTQTASNAAPAADPASVIGELSTGGDSSTEAKQSAAEFIASTQRRLDGLSSTLIRSHRSATDQVRNFLVKAREALKAGDVDGANNLATKAKLLLDDITR